MSYKPAVKSSHTLRFHFNLLSKFPACSSTPAVDDSNATFALYPKRSTLLRGRSFGRKSHSHSLSPAVHVASACDSFPVGLRPCTATMLQVSPLAHDSDKESCEHLLKVRLWRVDNHLQKVSLYLRHCCRQPMVTCSRALHTVRCRVCHLSVLRPSWLRRWRQKCVHQGEAWGGEGGRLESRGSLVGEAEPQVSPFHWFSMQHAASI